MNDVRSVDVIRFVCFTNMEYVLLVAVGGVFAATAVNMLNTKHVKVEIESRIR